MSRFADGSRAVRCECRFDDADLVRDLTLNLDADWRPRDAYLALRYGGQSLGAGWFRFDAHGVHCATIDGEGAPRELYLALPARASAFGAHPVLNDGLWTALFDHARPAVAQSVKHGVTYSRHPIGQEQIGLEPFELELHYRGEETVSVAAGRFECRHYSVQMRGLEAPFELWVMGEDSIVVRETWAGLPASYELAEFETDG